MNLNLADLGLVGCGGAGFPTHVKLAAKEVDHLIVNGAECEPLLHKDKELLHHCTDEFFRGLLQAISLTGAKQAHICVKKKYPDLVEHLQKHVPDTRIHVHPLGDFYPAGDEYELVWEAAKRLIPFGGIPLQIGCVVINVETLINLGRARPVVSKFLTVGGAVPHPLTVEVPVGTTFGEAIALTGLKKTDGFTFIDGGPMMGRIVASLDEVITKTCGGILVLPNTHPLIVRMTRTEPQIKRIARSACDQCTDCTELCPRRLLGYPVQPHRSMRTAQLASFENQAYSIDSVFCCECGLCTLFSCPEDLPPREITVMAKRHHLSQGVKPASWKGQPEIHPMRSARRVSIARLIKKLGLLEYDKPAPLTKVSLRPERVKLPLKMHIGVPAQPLVKVGDKVEIGQKVAGLPDGKLGAVVHASIAGRVTSIDQHAICISRE